MNSNTDLNKTVKAIIKAAFNVKCVNTQVKADIYDQEGFIERNPCPVDTIDTIMNLDECQLCFNFLELEIIQENGLLRLEGYFLHREHSEIRTLLNEYDALEQYAV